MANNTQVIRAWLDGHKAKSRNLKTDGYYLYSYELVIASGRQILDYTTNGDLVFVSMTTSRHVGLAKRALLNDPYSIDSRRLNRSKFIYGHSKLARTVWGNWEWCLECDQPTMHRWNGEDWKCDHAMVNTILVATIKAITARNAEDLGYLEE